MKVLLQIVLLCFVSSAFPQTLPLPARETNALGGNACAQKISSMNLAGREAAIEREIFAGNVPTFLRNFCLVSITNIADGKTNLATFYVAPDYLAIGSDADYFLTPMSPNTAQRIADRLGCMLPTRKMVDAIYSAAEVKLTPAPISPSAAMTTVPVFLQHNEMVRTQRAAVLASHPLGALVAGHQKDVVISARLAGATNKVAIYGWHQTNGVPIQPLYLGHAASWVDYSQCIRLVKRELIVNGETKFIADVLADPKLCGLISDEDVISNSRYPTNLAGDGGRNLNSNRSTTGKNLETSSGVSDQTKNESQKRSVLTNFSFSFPEKFSPGTHFGELVCEIELPEHVAQTFLSAGSGDFPVASSSPQSTTNAGQESPANPQTGMSALPAFELPNGVRIVINAPSPESFAPDKPVLLVFYALPNGNTIEQTIGKTLKPGDDWHFDIQHIGAQTRWLRAALTNRTIVVAYLEAATKSWPAWRKTHADSSIARMIEGVRGIFARRKLEVALTSHSGGGSLLFGYLNAVEKIPDDVVRIAFLDSNYAYDTKLDAAKLQRWLADSGEHRLCVLAYHDSVALLNGKPFVSEQGGTWGRSHLMLDDLGAQFKFTSSTNNGLETFSALDGRIQFLLKENPEKKIFHTVQVERNGFIHALVSGTHEEGRGYDYFGERAYGKWMDGD